MAPVGELEARPPMSVSDHTLLEDVARTTVDSIAPLVSGFSSLVGLAGQSIRAVAFWLAALLPLSYPPLLAAGVTANRPLGFVGLLCVNAVAFVLGHAHNRVDAER